MRFAAASRRFAWSRAVRWGLGATLLGLSASSGAARTADNIGPYGYSWVAVASLPDAVHTLIGVDDSTLPLPISHDGGATWGTSAFSPNDSIYAFLPSRTHPGTVWMGTAAGDIWTSTDSGRTATTTGHVPGSPSIAQLGRHGSMLVALEFSGRLARSTDMRHWTTAAFADGSFDATVTEDGVAYAVSADGTVKRSVDGGATVATSALAGASAGCPSYVIGNGHTAAAGVVIVDYCGHVWTSATGGAGFSPASTVPQGDPRSVTVDAGEPATIYVSTRTGLAVSRDAGATWSEPATAPSYMVLVPDASRPGVVFGLTVGGLQATYDHGATWQAIGPRVTAPDFVRTVARSSNAILAGTKDGLQVLPNGASAWHRATGLGPGPQSIDRILVDPLRPGVTFTASGTLDRSTDGGETWAPTATPMPASWDFALDPSAIGSIWVASPMLAHTTDDGATWSRLPLDALRLAVVAGSPQTLVLGRRDGAVWRSTDGGRTASLVIAAEYAGPHAIHTPQVVASPYTSGLVLAQTGRKEYRSTDGGATWSPLPVWLQLRYQPQFRTDGTIIAIDGIGEVVASPDGGLSWTTTPDPTDPSGVLTATYGIAIPPPPPPPAALTTVRASQTLAALAVASSVPRVLTVRRGVRSRLFLGVLAHLRYGARPVAAASTAFVTVRVVCNESRTRYCGGIITVRQGGRVMGRTPFTVPPGRHRHTYVVHVALVGALPGAAAVELRAALPWRSAVRATVKTRL
jgi:photosystem II stability/assembly factor-like uncharacterized protein